MRELQIEATGSEFVVLEALLSKIPPLENYSSGGLTPEFSVDICLNIPLPSGKATAASGSAVYRWYSICLVIWLWSWLLRSPKAVWSRDSSKIRMAVFIVNMFARCQLLWVRDGSWLSGDIPDGEAVVAQMFRFPGSHITVWPLPPIHWLWLPGVSEKGQMKSTPLPKFG